MAYDRYAGALYGYCHWMLHDSADAARALKNTFVIAAATLSDPSEPSKLRPRLFALARNECRRRIRPRSAAHDEEADAVSLPSDATGEASDETVRFPVFSLPSDATGEASDETVRFPVFSLPSDATGEASDETVLLPAPSLPLDATMPFRVVSYPTYGPAHVNGDRGQAELRSLISSILAGLKPRERGVIELNFRHDLHDNDLAIALGVSLSRADALASHARGRLEEALNALHVALTR